MWTAHRWGAYEAVFQDWYHYRFLFDCTNHTNLERKGFNCYCILNYTYYIKYDSIYNYTQCLPSRLFRSLFNGLSLELSVKELWTYRFRPFTDQSLNIQGQPYKPINCSYINTVKLPKIGLAWQRSSQSSAVWSMIAADILSHLFHEPSPAIIHLHFLIDKLTPLQIYIKNCTFSKGQTQCKSIEWKRSNQWQNTSLIFLYRERATGKQRLMFLFSMACREG